MTNTPEAAAVAAQQSAKPKRKKPRSVSPKQRKKATEALSESVSDTSAKEEDILNVKQGAADSKAKKNSLEEGQPAPPQQKAALKDDTRRKEEILELKRRAVALKEAGNTKEAKQLLEQARELDFEGVNVEDLIDPHRLKQFAVLKKKQGDKEAAKQALKKAQRMEQKNEEEPKTISTSLAMDDSTRETVLNTVKQDAAAKKRAKSPKPSLPGAYSASATQEPSVVVAAPSRGGGTTRSDTATKKQTGLKKKSTAPSKPGAYPAASEPSSVARPAMAQSETSQDAAPKSVRSDAATKKKVKAGLKKKGPSKPGAYSGSTKNASTAAEPENVATSRPTTPLDDSNRKAVRDIATADATTKRRAVGLKSNNAPSKPGAYAGASPTKGKRGRVQSNVQRSTTAAVVPSDSNIVQRTRDPAGEQKPGAQPATTMARSKKSCKRNKQQNESQRTATTPGAEAPGSNFIIQGSRDADDAKLLTASQPSVTRAKSRTKKRGDKTADVEAQSELTEEPTELTEEPIETHIPPPATIQSTDIATGDDEPNETLIEAQLVTEQSDAFVFQAVEVDPDADHKPIYKHKQFPKIAGAVCLVLIIIIVVVSVVATNSSGGGGPTEAPTMAPTGVSTNEAIVQYRMASWLEDPAELQGKSSPYYKALQWLVYEDKIDPEAPNLQQRCLLAAFYYSTTVNGDWSVCDDEVCQYTVKGKQGVSETRTEPRWLNTSTSECDWAGVECHGGDNPAVKQLFLENFRLSGSIMPEIGRLSRLEDLKLDLNIDMKGTVPSTLGMLSELVKLELGENSYTGTLPEEICNAIALEELDLGKNDLTGTIPSCLGNLVNLERLSFDKNDMTGTIPTELGQLVNLEEAEFDANELQGSVPSEMCAIEGLRKLKVPCDESKPYYVVCDPPCDCHC